MREFAGFNVIRESDGIDSLENAWNDPSTFLFLPEKAGVGEDWLSTQLAGVPHSHSRGRFCLLTSGSTGEPKLIFGVKERAERLARVLHKLQNSEPVKCSIVTLPLTYSFAFVNQGVWSKANKRDLIVTDGLRNPERLACELDETNDSMICLVGAQLPLIFDNFREKIFPNVIRIHFAGGPFPQSNLGDLSNMFPNARVFNNFGCAEAMPRLTIREVEDGGGLANDVGPPIEGVRLRISESGEVEFLSEYRADAQISSGCFSKLADDEWISTGDLGSISSDGNLILSGRSSAVFKRYGEKISLMQLSNCISESWDNHAVFYHERDSSDEPGHVLVLSPEPEKSQLMEILRSLRKRFPRAHWPLRIESIGEMPLLPNGKEDLLGVMAEHNSKIHWSQRI